MNTRDKVIAAARRHGVPEDLALDIAHKESRFNQGARSPKGAIGVMQLMPGTASDLGVNPHNEDQNIDGGVRYIGQQLKDFGGDRTLAMAAYNAGPGNVRKYGGVPPFKETQNYVGGQTRGRDMLVDASDIFGMSGAKGGARSAGGEVPDASDIFAPQKSASPMPAKPPPLPGQPGAVPVPQMGPGVTMERVAPYEGMKSEALGFKTEIARIADRLAPFSPANLIPGFREANAASGERLKASLERQAQQREPGKIGTFGGGVLASAALAGPTSPLVSGAISGAATGNATDLKGVLGETALGAAVGRGTALASDALQIGARKMLSKAPQIMNLEGLKKGYQEAYKAVDASGFAFPKAEIGKLVDSFEQTMASRALSKTAKEDARSIIQYARKELASGDVSVSRLEALRRDIYDAMVKKGGDAGAIGGAFRGQIDKLMDSVPNPDLKRGRELYKRWTTADFVNRASKSADRAAEQTYGGDFGRKVKDRLAPLVDEMKPTRNIRGASPDVIAGIEKVVRGSKTQNLASTLGGMTDVRRLGGKLLQGTLGAGGAAGAIGTGGASVIPSLLLQGAIAGGGAGLTATASGIARKNVNDLIKLIAAGGSKQALARVPTKTSQAVETAIARGARPALVAASVPALAAARAPNRKDGKRPNSR